MVLYVSTQYLRGVPAASPSLASGKNAPFSLWVKGADGRIDIWGQIMDCHEPRYDSGLYYHSPAYRKSPDSDHVSSYGQKSMLTNNVATRETGKGAGMMMKLCAGTQMLQ